MKQNELDERRRAPRMATYIEAVARSIHGVRQKVEVTDLSVGGCGVVVSGHPLIADAVYGLKLGNLETLVSTAAWTDGQVTGLRFDRSLHPAVADHVAGQHPRSQRPAEVNDD